MSSRGSQGFTLIELVITIVIIVILVLLGLPSFQQWLASTKVRTAAESIQNGLREARNEAVQRGTNVLFQLTGTNTADWTVCVAATTGGCASGSPNPIDQYNSAGGALGVVVGSATAVGSFATALTSGLPSTVTFNSFGRVASGSGSPVRIDASSTSANTRRLVVTISSGGQTRLCDPQLSLSVSAQGCY